MMLLTPLWDVRVILTPLIPTIVALSLSLSLSFCVSLSFSLGSTCASLLLCGFTLPAARSQHLYMRDAEEAGVVSVSRMPRKTRLLKTSLVFASEL